MKPNTQNAKIKAITEKTLVLGIDIGSETHYAISLCTSTIETAVYENRTYGAMVG